MWKAKEPRLGLRNHDRRKATWRSRAGRQGPLPLPVDFNAFFNILLHQQFFCVRNCPTFPKKLQEGGKFVNVGLRKLLHFEDFFGLLRKFNDV